MKIIPLSLSVLSRVSLSVLALAIAPAVSAQTEGEDVAYEDACLYGDDGLEYPLKNAATLSGQELADSASVVLARCPEDVYALECRALGRMQTGDYAGGVDDAFSAWNENGSDYGVQLLFYAADKDPGAVIDFLLPMIGPMENSDVMNDRYNSLGARQIVAMAYKAKLDMANAYRVLEVTPGADIDENWEGPLKVTRSTVLLKSGHPEDALKLVKPLYDDEDGRFGSVVNNYCLALRDCGQVDEALRVWKEAGELGDDNRYHHLLDYANLLGVTGRYKEAFNGFDTLIADLSADMETYGRDNVAPLLSEVLLRKGIYLIQSGDSEAGRDCLNRSLSLGNENQPTGMEKFCYAWLGDRDKALDWLGKETDPNPSVVGAVYSILGDKDKALENLSKALELHIVSAQSLRYDPNYKPIFNTKEMKRLLKDYRPMKL